jgi:hypothetical protein
MVVLPSIVSRRDRLAAKQAVSALGDELPAHWLAQALM